MPSDTYHPIEQDGEIVDYQNSRTGKTMSQEVDEEWEEAMPSDTHTDEEAKKLEE